MPRTLLLLVLAGVVSAAGCRLLDDRRAVFPRHHDRIDAGDDAYADRFRDRYTLPAAVGPPATCVPCGGSAGGYPVGGLTPGSPVMTGGMLPVMTGGSYGQPGPVVSGGFGLPTGYVLPGSPTGPVFGPPVYPNGQGSPVRPRRDDELPLPGEYSRPRPADDVSRTAPRPPTSLPVGR